jgi:hypothetical protein
MSKLPKKRGRPRKLLKFVADFGEDQKKFNDYLRKVGLPQEKYSTKEFQQDAVPITERDALGRKIRPTKDILGESLDHVSFTQQTNPLRSLHEEAAANEAVKLSRGWCSYLEYMDVIFAAISSGDNRRRLNQLALNDARSRYWEQPPPMLDQMNESFGMPAKFRQLWASGELDIRKRYRNRRDNFIEIVQLPPQAPEEDDD